MIRLAGIALLALGCSDAPAPAPPTPSAPAAPAPKSTASAAGSPADRAAKVYDRRCRLCHGPQGKGDGPAAGTLNPRPRAFDAPGWQATVTDAHIARVILEGGAAVGLSGQMPPHADLKPKPEVVEALVAYVRGLGGAAR